MIHPIRLNLGIFTVWEKLRSNDVKRDNFQLYRYISTNGSKSKMPFKYLKNGIYETTEFLELFLRNLLLNENHPLHNRTLRN